MDGLSKINFNLDKETIKEKPVVMSNPKVEDLNVRMKKVKHKFHIQNFLRSRRAKVIAGVLLILILFSVFGVYLPAKRVYNSAKLTYKDAQAASWAIKTQNVSLASEQLAKTKQDLEVTKKDLLRMEYLKFIPVVNWYYNDAYHMVNAGEHGLSAAIILIDAIKPYADVLGLKGQGSFVGGTAQQRIETAVRTIGKITPKIDEISNELDYVRSEIDQVSPGHYPSIWLGKKAKDTIASVRGLTDQSVSLITSAKPLIKILPQVLGEPNEKKYLVLFQNDKELRPTGGFITAYSVFRLDSGVIHVDRSSDIYSLDATVSNKPTAPKLLQKYLNVSVLNLRDNNLSPDFKVSMDDFYKMYKTAGDSTKIDGIFAVDTHALVSAMNILGNIDAAGTTFTTQNDPRCDCPQVIYQLEAIADQPVQGIKEDRKGVIGELMYAIMNKAFTSSPKQYWGPLFQTMISEMSQKHVLFYMNNQDAQLGFEGLNASGRIIDFKGDYFHLNEANLGGAKSNMFVTRSVTQDYNLQGDGSIVKTVTVSYKNPFIPSDCNLERGNLCLNAKLRDWFRIYVPKGSELLSSQGSQVKITTYEELGKTVFDGFLEVYPQGATKLVVSYKLPFKLGNDSVLPILYQKQPGTLGDAYTVTIGGRAFQQFNLSSDNTINLRLR